MKPEAVVFAGGGCRCFWQAGFWSRAGAALELEPRVVAAVSAGAAFACAAIAQVIDRVVADFVKRAARNPRNVYPGNVWRRRPMFPHGEMYRAALLASMDAATLERLRGPTDLRILLAHPPSRMPLGPALLFGIAAYQLDRITRRGVHPLWARRLGFSPVVVSASSCRTPEELADLILHSSCTPPVTPLFRRDGRPVIDGGIVDNVPVEVVADATEVLVLLTRRYPPERIPRVPGRLYVQPSEPVPISKWDYTSPRLIEQTFDLGRRDGDAFVRAIEARPEGAASPGGPRRR
jgi:predicted acylesterase/phospholipase RssA